MRVREREGQKYRKQASGAYGMKYSIIAGMRIGIRENVV